MHKLIFKEGAMKKYYHTSIGKVESLCYDLPEDPDAEVRCVRSSKFVGEDDVHYLRAGDLCPMEVEP
jgi:hypothetical protein